MATLRPFRALRPRPDKAKDVVSMPYDVLDEEEARALAEGNPYSFLRIIRPEIELPGEVDVHDDRVYEIGAENLRRYRESDYAVCDTDDALFAYRIKKGAHEQLGLFGCVSVEDYDRGVIRRHEKTRPDKEDDRTRHILTQRAHAEPVMLVYPDHEEVDALLAEATRPAPLYDITTDDGARHTLWRIESTEALRGTFDEIERLYVADGHHRCKAASRAAKELSRNGRAEAQACAFFPAAIFPVSAMNVMAYNRVVRSLPVPPHEFLEELSQSVGLKRGGAKSAPEEKGTVSLYLEGQWHLITLPPTRRETAAATLDVARLSEFVLEPLLGITDPRTDPNLDFVGGSRGPEAIKAMVDEDRAEAAFSMYPTSIEELVKVSDEGLLMPPKSTWFEPKLCSGLLVHLFDECS